MKYGRLSAAKSQDSRELNTQGLVRIASLLTLGAMIVVLPALICSGNPAVWVAAGPLCIFTVAFIWSVTLTIGWLLMMAVAVCRIGRRMHREIHPGFDEHGHVWDRWMDGPEALVP